MCKRLTRSGATTLPISGLEVAGITLRSSWICSAAALWAEPSSQPNADLVIKALDMAHEQRGRLQNVMCHSDQGIQYVSRNLRQRLSR